MSPNLLKVQAYLLTANNAEHRNALHLACANGNIDMCKFIIEKAGPTNLNILSFIINDKDELMRTPLFLLC